MSQAPGRWRELIARFGLLLALVVMVIVLASISDRFLTTSNIINVLRQISVNAIIAFGMTVVIIGAGIDLSVGSLLALVGVDPGDLRDLVAGIGYGDLHGLLLGQGLHLFAAACQQRHQKNQYHQQNEQLVVSH